MQTLTRNEESGVRSQEFDFSAAPRAGALGVLAVYTPPAEFLEWKELEGAGLIMQAYYKYAAWDWRRFNLEGVRTSARFIEERVRDDIRVGKRQGVDLAGYSLNSHLTKPILMHMLEEHPEWRGMFEVRGGKAESGNE